ncbi:MAG TPA: Rieske 2Fe-2S domain-containing protein [Kofleriaceae bacterium]|jgi:nitrite reductase/ring-hydroxylating ferredoxin subunit
MRRAAGLQALSRRTFCALAGAVGAELALQACTDSARPVSTGPLGDDDETPPDSTVAPDDAAPVDGAHVADAFEGLACTTTPTDVGAPSSYTLNVPKYFSSGKFFVVKDATGFYALTARCTHEGATCTVQGSDIHCSRHNANFTLNGAVISGPPHTALQHYAMCNMGSGNLGVITSMAVSATTRIQA